MDLKKNVYKGIKWNTVATIVNSLVQVLKLVVLTRILDKSDFGLIAIASMVIGFTEIFSEIGLTTGIIHKQNITTNQYSSIYWMNIVLSFVVFLLLCLFTPIIVMFYDQPILHKLIPLLGLQILFNAFGKMFQTIKTKEMEFDFISKVSIISSLLGFFATWILAVFGVGVFSLAIGQLIMVGFRQLTFVIVGRKQQKIALHLNIREISDFFKIGVYRLGSQMLDFASSKIDVFLIGKFFGMDDLGIYNLAKELIMRPYSIINSLVTNVASSAFAKFQTNMQLVRESYKKIINTICIISIPIYVVLFVFSDTIVYIMYGEGFMKVALFLRILSFVGIECSISSQGAILQISFGRTDVGFKWTVYRVIMTVSSIFVASMFTIVAVAYGQLIIAIISIVLFWYVVVYPISSIKLSNYVNSFKKTLLISIGFALPFLIIVSVFEFNVYINILLILLYIGSLAFYYYFFEKELLLALVKIRK